MDQREQFIKNFVQAGKAKGASQQEVANKLKLALAEYDQMSIKPTKPEDTRTGFQKVADFGGVKTTTGNVGVLGFLGQGKVTESAGASASASFQTANTLTQLAKKETNPQKKKQLLDQARAIMEGSAQEMDTFQQDLSKRQDVARISEKEIERGPEQFALRRGVGQSAELAALLMPFTKEARAAQAALKLGTAGQRIAQAGVTGATTGGLQGLAGATREDDNFGDGAARVATSTAIGGVTGMAMQAAGEGLRALAQKFKPPQKISQTSKDLSDKINETKRVIKEGEQTNADQLRSTQFLKYKNKDNALINEVEVARILDDIEMQYGSTDQLRTRSPQLARAIQNVKEQSLKNQGGKIDVSEVVRIYDDEVSKSLMQKADTKKIFRGIVGGVSDIQGLDGTDPVKADNLASELGNEARKYFKQWQKTGDPAAEHMYRALNNSKNYIRDQIDNQFAQSIDFTPQQIEQVAKYSPKLAQAIQDKALSMADMNYIQAMLFNASSLAKDTAYALSGAGQQVLGGKPVLNIPILSQAGDVVGQAADVVTQPLKAGMRTQTAKVLAGGSNLLGNILGGGRNMASGISNVAGAGIQGAGQTVAPNMAATNLTPKLLKILGIQ